ncbi:hypothetical protein Clacol_000990 [Clathrus columnatus]|uniref:Uncharacterized protein n=1 Tax=Clathrus columnatus TaxID=1419009 RepID=A0AAV4ZXI3_9AGAM|nr:hypothetical protein Clacol_000990 [Clathrus columnatus]
MAQSLKFDGRLTEGIAVIGLPLVAINPATNIITIQSILSEPIFLMGLLEIVLEEMEMEDRILAEKAL